MTNFAGTDRTIACGAETPNGTCTRRVEPGRSCGYHRPPPPPEPEPLRPPLCRCPRPVVVDDDVEMAPRCLDCAKAVPSALVPE